MKRENTYFPVSNLFSKQLNLSDFGFEKPALKKIKEINKDIKPNKLLKFIFNLIIPIRIWNLLTKKKKKIDFN